MGKDRRWRSGGAADARFDEGFCMSPLRRRKIPVDPLFRRDAVELPRCCR